MSLRAIDFGPAWRRKLRQVPMTTVKGELKRRTEKAFLAEVNGAKVWLPRSLVNHREGSFAMPVWLARERGLTPQTRGEPT